MLLAVAYRERNKMVTKDRIHVSTWTSVKEEERMKGDFVMLHSNRKEKMFEFLLFSTF